ncbi:hypothetical protein V3C99_010054 [Haemonchus contortus]
MTPRALPVIAREHPLHSRPPGVQGSPFIRFLRPSRSSGSRPAGLEPLELQSNGCIGYPCYDDYLYATYSKAVLVERWVGGGDPTNHEESIFRLLIPAIKWQC